MEISRQWPAGWRKTCFAGAVLLVWLVAAQARSLAAEWGVGFSEAPAQGDGTVALESSAGTPPSSAPRGEAPGVTLRFFWTRTCPHCQQARPFVHRLAEELPWLELHDYELTGNPDAARLYVELARRLGQEARSVPAFVFCGQMMVGFDDAASVGAELRRALEGCWERGGAVPATRQASAAPASGGERLPLLGDADLEQWSLPLVAIALGTLDSFNPCAFFVLLFLLSLLVNARSRLRMLIVGGLFVAVSGVVYFLFMAAWLNLFLLVGQLLWVTVIAGLLAVLMGALNVKDYFWWQAGPSLSMPGSARPGLFARMRALVGADSLAPMLAGTFALAVVANSYELLCTAGFPMVFTRILTLQSLPPAAYYGYLALYCLVYVVPLLIIVSAFVITLGRRKLTEREGRTLKLVSGMMMLALGALLLVDPALLTDIRVTAGLLVGALLFSWVVVRVAPRGTAGA
jgi:hypothetical protein